MAGFPRAALRGFRRSALPWAELFSPFGAQNIPRCVQIHGGSAMSRPVLLFSGQWTHLPLEELAQKLNDWGYQGLELCCWGDHFEVQRALSEDEYCQKKLDLLARHDLQLAVLANHRV